MGALLLVINYRKRNPGLCHQYSPFYKIQADFDVNMLTLSMLGSIFSLI